jgi:hypothetical protein
MHVPQVDVFERGIRCREAFNRRAALLERSKNQHSPPRTGDHVKGETIKPRGGGPRGSSNGNVVCGSFSQHHSHPARRLSLPPQNIDRVDSEHTAADQNRHAIGKSLDIGERMRSEQDRRPIALEVAD